jgi:hypothetical protein
VPRTAARRFGVKLHGGAARDADRRTDRARASEIPDAPVRCPADGPVARGALARLAPATDGRRRLETRTHPRTGPKARTSTAAQLAHERGPRAAGQVQRRAARPVPPRCDRPRTTLSLVLTYGPSGGMRAVTTIGHEDEL